MEQGGPSDEKGEDMEWKMTRLDRLASCHQVADDALQAAAQTRAALFRRQRNALIPINQLPSELLSAILIESVNDYQPHRTKALQMLAQVAWQWWQTIKSDSQFWAHITPPMEGAELQIRKAGNLPLRLHWTDDVDATEDGDATDWDALGDLVQRHARRWTGIELEHFRGEEASLQALCTIHFPRLKYLRVDLTYNPERISENWRLNLAQCQNLQEVYLPIMPYLPVAPSSNSPIHLRTLHLDLSSMDSCSSHDLESLLRLTPQLVELRVENLLNDTNPPAPFGAPIIDLPNLGRLEFCSAVTGEERDWIPLLAQIRAPRLENLALHYQSGVIRLFTIGGQTTFTVLATWPSASTNRPGDGPLHSVLRNAGPSAAWGVTVWKLGTVVTAKGSGSGLRIMLDHSSHDQLHEGILTHLAPFGLPVDLRVSFRDGETAELEFWDKVLDATPSLRTFAVASSVKIARQVIDRLSTKAPSSSCGGPRAPHLEELTFRLKAGPADLWSQPEGDLGEAVKAMLDKRREIFIQSGVIDPPKLVVMGPEGLVYDESECRWLG